MKKITYFPVPAALLRLIAIAGLLALDSSCVRNRMEEELSATPAQSEQVEVKIRLRAAQPSVATRSLSEEQENLIHDVYVFFLQKTDEKVYAAVKARQVASGGGDPGNWTFTALLTVNAGMSATFDCLALANVETSMQGKNLADFNGKTYDELQTELVSEVLTPTALPGAEPAEGMVMWGKGLSAVSVPGTAGTDITVPVIRALASVEVGVGAGPAADNLSAWTGWDGNDASGHPVPFVLKKVYVYRPNNRYAFMPLAAAYGADTRKVTAPSPAGVSAAMDAPFEYDVTGYGIRHEIYLPEANIRQLDGGAGHTGTPGDAGHTDRCALVVCGSYDGHPDSYYRIDFNDNGSPRALIDLLRNHRYYVSITSARGDGEASADEAYTSRRVNLGIEITGWEDNFEDVIFDGVDHVYVERKTILFSGDAGKEGEIAIGSNVPPAEWQMSLNGGQTFVSDETISNADVEVTKPGVSEGGSLLIKTRTALPEGVSTRADTLRMKIHRLEFSICIRQDLDSPDEWGEGGDIPNEI